MGIRATETAGAFAGAGIGGFNAVSNQSACNPKSGERIKAFPHSWSSISKATTKKKKERGEEGGEGELETSSATAASAQLTCGHVDCSFC